MPSDDLSKGKRRSARVYVNAAQLTPEELRERLDILREYFPGDDPEVNVPKPKKAKKLPPRASNDANSGQAMVQGYQSVMSPDRGKGTRVVGAEAAIPTASHDQLPHAQNSYCTVAGCCGSTEVAPLGDAPRNPFRLAKEYADSLKSAAQWAASSEETPVHHAVSYQQQPKPGVAETILSRLRTNQEASIQQAGFHSWTSATDSPPGAPGNQPTVHAFDAAQAAGALIGTDGHDVLNSVQHAPAVRQDYGIARNSGTPANGTHNTPVQTGNYRLNTEVQGTAVALKSRLDIIKDAMREQGVI